MDIATLGIKIDNSQIRAAGADLNALGTTGERVQSKLAGAFGALGAALGIASLLRKVVDESVAAQAATAQLEAALRSNGGAAGYTAAQLQEMAAGLQATTAYSDDAIVAAQALLLSFHSIQGVTFERTTRAMLDLAARMGGDLSGAALQLGKALESPATGMTQLKRAGIIFSDAQERVIKDLADTGRLAEAQAVMLSALEVKMGGAAVAARQTLGGALQALHNDFGDMFEATTKETGALISFINMLGGAARVVTAHRDVVIALAYALGGVALAAGAASLAMTAAPLVAFGTALSAAATQAVFLSRVLVGLAADVGFRAALPIAISNLTAFAGGIGAAAGAALAAAAPLLALGAMFGTLVYAIMQARTEMKLWQQEVDGAARDALVKQAFDFRRQFGEQRAQEVYPTVFPSKSAAKLKEETDAEHARAIAAQEMITALRQEADLFGKSAEQARLYKIATSDLTDAEKALAVVQANRITAAERLAAAREAEWQEIDQSIRRLEAEVDARQAAIKAVAELAAAIKVARKEAGNETNTALLDQLKAVKEAAESAKNAEKTGGSDTGKAIADDWERTSRAIVAAGQALGSFNEGTALTLQNLISVVSQAEQIATTLATAGGKVASGDWLALVASAAGLLSSLFGGGESPEAKRAREVTQANTEAIRKNTEQRSFAQDASGNALTAAAAAVKALLAVPSVNGGSFGTGLFGPRGGLNTATVDTILAGLGTNLHDLKAQADALGITLNTQTGQTFIDSLKQLDLLLKQSALVAFADTFSGKLKALEASWRAFNVTDPLTKLTQQLKVAGDIGTITHDAQGRLIRTAGTGSSAINAASAGLDLATTAGRNQLTANLQALFRQLQAGALSASQLGGLTAQEFLDQLTGLIDLVRQAEDAARARERGLQDLEVRRLRAIKQDTAADAMAFALAQQREYEDAVLAGADATTLATLAEVQRAEAIAHATEALDGAITTLREFIGALKLDSNLSALSPTQRLEEARQQYEAILAQAQAGDAAAAGKIPDAARAFLEASRAVNASGPRYAADFARVVAETDAVASMFEGMRDTATLQLEATRTVADNTGKLVEGHAETLAVLSEGFTQMIGKQTDMEAAIEELIAQTKLGNEGKLL